MKKILFFFKTNKLIITYITLILTILLIGAFVFFADPYIPENITFPVWLHRILEGTINILLFLIFLKTGYLYSKTGDKRMAIISGACFVGSFLNLYNVNIPKLFPYDALTLQTIQETPELFYLLAGKLIVASSFLITVFYSAKSHSIRFNFVKKVYSIYVGILLLIILICKVVFPLFLTSYVHKIYLIEKNLGIFDEIFYFLAVFIYLGIEKPKSKKIFLIFISGLFLLGIAEIFYTDPSLIQIDGIISHILRLIGFLFVLLGLDSLKENPDIVSFRQKISGYLSLFLVFSYTIFSSLLIASEGIGFPPYFPFLFYIFILVTTVFQYVTSDRFIQPIVNIINTVDKFNPGQKPDKIDVISNDEIGLLTDKLNKISALYWEHSEELKRKQDRETVLRRIIETIRRTLNLESVKHEIVNQVGLLLKADRVFFADYDLNTQKYYVSTEREYRSSDKIKSFAGYDFTATPGFIKSIREKHIRGEDIIFSDLDKYLDENNLRDTSIEKFYREFGFISSAAINIYYGKSFLGDLVITFENQRDISDDEINLIKTIAHQAGIAIYQSNLYETIKKQVERETLLRKIINNILTSENLEKALNLISEEVGNLFDAERVKIRNYNEKENVFSETVIEYRKNEQIPSVLEKGKYSKEVSEYITNILAKERKPFIVNDVENSTMPDYMKEFCRSLQTKSLIESPIFYKNKLLASIIIENTTDPKEWKQENLDLLTPICQQIAIGINLFNLNDQLSHSLENEKILREVSEHINMLDSHEKIDDYSLNQLLKVFNVERAVHFHFIDDSVVITNERTLTDNTEKLKTSIHFSKERLSEIIAEPETLIAINDTESEIKNENLKEYLISSNIKSFIVYPIIKKQSVENSKEIVEVTMLANSEKHTWTEYEKNLVKRILDITSILSVRSLQKQEIEEIKQTFIATLTHDLRSPILAEQKALEAMISKRISCSSEYLEDIYKTNEELLKIVNNLLSVYHYESGKPILNRTQTSIKDLIEEAVRSLKYLAQDKESQIYTDIQEDLPLINVDRDEINRVISNLIGNAIKHTRKGTQIKISARQENNNIQVAIQDNGEGIPKENIDKIFQRYPTEKRKVGTGLGLYLSKQIVEAHNGKIWFETEEGVGTTFYFELAI